MTINGSRFSVLFAIIVLILFGLTVSWGALARLEDLRSEGEQGPDLFDPAERSLFIKAMWPLTPTEALPGLDEASALRQADRWVWESGFSSLSAFLTPASAGSLLPPGERQDLLGVFTLKVGGRAKGSQANVYRAADAVHEAVVAPEEEISFNEIVGIRTEERGFKAGPMFNNGEVVMGVGGGICMVSTAIYNLALEAGLAILERHPHSGPVSYAAPGRDAAVVYGASDLRFRNTTGHYLLIRALDEGRLLHLALYGTKTPGESVEILSQNMTDIPGRVIVKTDPALLPGESVEKQKERPGFEVTTIRIFRMNGKLVRREILSTDRLPARDAVVLISSRPPSADVFAMKSIPLAGYLPSPGTGTVSKGR
ncbi:MAG: VanW family protein [Armatimonadetes bacterium]|nr:VanW family protein [Armatimonadota bacterium]